MPSSFVRFTLLALPLATMSAACGSEVETGHNGQLELVPSDCGKLYCDLDDGIAVGGSLDVTLRGVDGQSASGLRLISNASWVVGVDPELDDGFEPRFRVSGNGPGLADLIAIDAYGYEVDYLPVRVATIESIAVDATVDGATMTDGRAVGFDHAYLTTAGARLKIDVTGFAGGLEPTGEVQYRVTFDPALYDALEPGSEVDRAHLIFRVPSGDHALTVIAPGGVQSRLLISGR